MPAKRVIVAEDDSFIREKVCNMVKECLHAPDITEITMLQRVFLTLIKDQRFDIIIMSFELLGDDWKRQARKLQALCHKINLIYITFNKVGTVNKLLLNLGCFSCIPKHSLNEVFFHSLWLSLNGFPYIPYHFLISDNETKSPPVTKRKKYLLPDGSCLTNKQFETLKYLSEGLSNKEIALNMGITEATVKLHMNSFCGLCVPKTEMMPSESP